MRLYQTQRLLKKNYIDIIRYFSLEENRQFHCRLKSFKVNDPILIGMMISYHE